MLYLDTCVLLALLTPEVHSPFATAFLEEASEALAISRWSTTELHSALALKVRTGALSPAEADRVLDGFERSLAPALLLLDLQHQDFLHANTCLRGWSTSLRAADALHRRSPPAGAPRSAAWTRPSSKQPGSSVSLPC